MNMPNKITCVRLATTFLIIIIFSLSFLPGSEVWAGNLVIFGFNIGFSWIDLVCCIIFILGSITDAIDGHIARSRHLITNLGKFLDPLADKALVDSALILLCARVDWYGHHQILPMLVVLFVFRDLAMDGLRMLASQRGIVLAANIWGKVKTGIQMGLIPVLFLNGFPFSLIPDQLNLEYWMANRYEKTYIIMNIFVIISLFFSLLSLGIYIGKNKNVFKEEK